MEPSHLDLPLTPSLLGHGSSTASSHDPGERDQKWELQHTPGVSRINSSTVDAHIWWLFSEGCYSHEPFCALTFPTAAYSVHETRDIMSVNNMFIIIVP